MRLPRRSSNISKKLLQGNINKTPYSFFTACQVLRAYHSNSQGSEMLRNCQKIRIFICLFSTPQHDRALHIMSELRVWIIRTQRRDMQRGETPCSSLNSIASGKVTRATA